jgi:hypothetical protein
MDPMGTPAGESSNRGSGRGQLTRATIEQTHTYWLAMVLPMAGVRRSSLVVSLRNGG